MSADKEATSNMDPESEGSGASRAALDYGSDIRLMLDYCRTNGISLPDGLAPTVAAFHVARRPKGDPQDLTANVRLHGQLSALIEPATPRTLSATAHTWRPFRLGAALVLLVILVSAAFVGIAGYAATVPAAEKALSLLAEVNYFFAALLGAAFSGLLTAYPFFRERTFDPRFLLSYEVRLTIGIVAGMVLANLGSGLFAGEGTLAKLGPGMIALLGGYSAEAVRLVLDRLVQVLVTVVRGGDSGDEQRIAIAKEILDISQLAASDTSGSPDVRAKLDRLLKKLRQG